VTHTSYKKQKQRSRLAYQVIAVIISLLMFVPIYLVLVNSSKDSAQARSMGIELPASFHRENYLTVIKEGKLGQAFANSLLYASFANIICLI